MVQTDWYLPDSDLYVIRPTDDAGRAVFARTNIPHGTALLTTSHALSPIAHVLLRPYRREVCAFCFAYDRGREWKIRVNTAGVVFCSEECQRKWRDHVGDVGLEAHEAVESLVKQQQRRYGGNAQDSEDTDADMEDAHSTFDPRDCVSLTAERIDEEWSYAEEAAELVLDARSKERTSKTARRALRLATESPVDGDLLFYYLSGVLEAHRSAVSTSATDLSLTSLLPSLVALADDPLVFSNVNALEQYIQGYSALLAVLPLQLVPFLKSSLCRALASRASHNAFSIRPVGSSDGEQSGEFFGWGVWPEISMCNHSCSPNVRKERRGRSWHFYIDRPNINRGVGAGEQLCITYLGGDERDLGLQERRKKLLDEWGFLCCCPRCHAESKELQDIAVR